MPTDKNILNKGIKKMVWALPMFFVGPSVIHSSFKNTQHYLFIPILALGIIICLLAVILSFLGLRLMVRSLTDQ
jgi:hypothetical protein